MEVFTGWWRAFPPVSVGASVRWPGEAVAYRQRHTVVGMAAFRRIDPIFGGSCLVSFIASPDSARSLEDLAYMV